MSDAPESPTSALEALTPKQRGFCVEYVCNGGNGTRAILEAYDTEDEATAASMARENLRKPQIKAAIAELMREESMGSDELIHRLTTMARGSLEYFMGENGQVDLAKARRAKRLHLLKRLHIKPTEFGDEIRIELHDPKGALGDLARILGIDKQRVELTGKDGGPLETGGKLDLSNGQLEAVAQALKAAGALGDG